MKNYNFNTFNGLDRTSIAGDNQKGVVVHRQLNRAIQKSVANDAHAIATTLDRQSVNILHYQNEISEFFIPFEH